MTESNFQLLDNGKLQKIGTFGMVTSKGSVAANSPAPAASSGVGRREQNNV
jgi:hypothetical protein